MEKLPTSSKALRYLPFLVASAFFMQMLDATILNTAIPTIARSFNSHPLQLHSLVTAYMLTVCVLIPASGWISDKLGSRRTFLLAISIFSVGSLLCALSASITMMTVCRVIQGIGGAFLMPVGRLVILRSYPRSMFVNVLNIVTIPQDDGTQVYYFCDGETLESSNIIYTFKANGFAWTKSWNDGNPVWKYGFSKDGNAIYNMLAAYKISTEYLDAECVTAEKLSAEYKQSVTTEMEETVDEKLTDYSTTEETKTLIANTGGTIRTEVAESVKTVTDTTNAKIDDRLAQAKDYTDSVHQEITTEYSTKLEETSKGFNMSVNSLTDRITEQGNEVNSYREQLQTYFGFSEDGLEIGKKVNGEKQQYSINIDNERMGFLQDGSEVAFIQYNKLHINAVEAMDRLSVGAAADGGYFDFISTEYGMGVKWRAVEKTDNASIVSVMKIPRRASKYVPVVDEDNIFQMEGVNEE